MKIYCSQQTDYSKSTLKIRCKDQHSEGGRNGHGLLTAAFNLTTWLDPLQ